MAVAPFDFRVLGPLEVRRNGELLAVAAPKQRALLGLLLLRANELITPDQLVEELWGEEPPATARASLRNQIHALRRLLGAETLERRPGGYVLHVEPDELDVERFERLVAEARRAEPRERAAKLRSALALWRGMPLVEFPSQPFAQHEIARLEEERLTALEERIDVELELGEHAEVIAELESLVERYPLRERIWGQLMLALYRVGRQADALATYRRAHRTFVDTLGIEPGASLRELQRAVLVQDAALDDPEQRPGSPFERAAALLESTGRARAESLYDYAVALLRSGERRRALSMLEAAERLAAAVGEPGIAERARLYLSYLSIWTEGKSPQEHVEDAARAARRFAAQGEDKSLCLALFQQAHLLDGLGRSDEAVEIAGRWAEVAARIANPWEQALARGTLAMSLANGSTPVETAIARCEAELASAGPEEPSPLRVWLALIDLYAQAGRSDDARMIAESAVTTARREGRLVLLTVATGRSGLPAFRRADYATAARHLRAALALAETENDGPMALAAAGEAASVLALSGDLREAARFAHVARTTRCDTFPTNVLWRSALALVAAHEGRTEEALLLSDDARVHASASDHLTLRGETLEQAATVRRLAGDGVGEAEALAEALALYERKGNLVGSERVRLMLSERGGRGD